MGKRSRQDDTVSEASSESLPTPAASPAKIQEVEVDDETSHSGTMQCSLPPHQPQTFASADEFDIHYAQEHTNRCSSCGKNFPSAHYLSLHIDENHNPMREVLAAQGERTYACLIPDCDRKCSTPQKRRLHSIDKHMFPKTYNFHIIDQGIDRTSSLLLTGQRRRMSTGVTNGHQRRGSRLPAATSVDSTSTFPSVSDSASTTTSEGRKTDADRKIDDLEQSFAALQFVPPSVRTRQRNKKMGK